MPNQQRQDMRLPVEARIFIELVAPGTGTDEHGKLVTCKTLNVSRQGLQVAVEDRVDSGLILQIGVDLPGPEDTLYLAAEVRWCMEIPDDRYPWVVGFRILNSRDSDVERWAALLTTMDN